MFTLDEAFIAEGARGPEVSTIPLDVDEQVLILEATPDLIRYLRINKG